MLVQVVGKGCNSYYKLLRLAEKWSKRKGKEIVIEEICRNDKIKELGIVNLPVLLIDGKIYSQGVNIQEEEINNLFKRLICN